MLCVHAVCSESKLTGESRIELECPVMIRRLHIALVLASSWPPAPCMLWPLETQPPNNRPNLSRLHLLRLFQEPCLREHVWPQ